MSIESLILKYGDILYTLKEYYTKIKNDPITIEHYRRIIITEGDRCASF
ncbi:MAG: hypothetical protein GQ477_01135 [Nanohaloarchaea archaeon]|nr:hypothetical protein [Candidatus Nanohaloarchaea archaeon]